MACAAQRHVGRQRTPFCLAPKRAPAAPRRARLLIPSPTAAAAATSPWAAAANTPPMASIGSASLKAFNRLQKGMHPVVMSSPRSSCMRMTVRCSLQIEGRQENGWCRQGCAGSNTVRTTCLGPAQTERGWDVLEIVERLRSSRPRRPLLAQLRHSEARQQSAQHRQDSEEEDTPLCRRKKRVRLWGISPQEWQWELVNLHQEPAQKSAPLLLAVLESFYLSGHLHI